MPVYEELSESEGRLVLGETHAIAAWVSLGAAVKLGIPVPAITYFRPARRPEPGPQLFTAAAEFGHAWAKYKGRMWINVEQPVPSLLATVSHEAHHVAFFLRATAAELWAARPGTPGYNEQEDGANAFMRQMMAATFGSAFNCYERSCSSQRWDEFERAAAAFRRVAA